jgi:CPA1 family monovalent cation:H+ antiporter
MNPQAINPSHAVEIILILMFTVALLSLIATRIKVLPPMIMVIGGLLISLIPGFPSITLDPHLLFLLILPPLLYYSGSQTSWRDFRKYLRSITLLATGLVIATTFAIAWGAVTFIPGMTWSYAILLGAIIAPPDALAATAIAQRLNLPRRIITLLEGESLVNDATSLVIYKIALVAILTETFSLFDAATNFIWMGGVGILLGVTVGVIVSRIRQRIEDPPVEITISLLTPFAAYIPAEALGLSGILSAVSCGLYIGWKMPDIMGSETRLQSASVWRMVVFQLNNMVFLLIGLQLPQVLYDIQEYPASDLLGYTAALSLSMIAIRMLWVFPGAYLPRLLFKHIRDHEPPPKPNEVLFVGWAGMRGVVSLAAALALPLFLNNSHDFPHRDLIIFLTFAIILVTLVLQGSTMEYVVKLLHIRHDQSRHREERLARQRALQSALEVLEKKTNDNQHNRRALTALMAEVKMDLEKANMHLLEGEENLNCLHHHTLLRRDLITAQRDTIVSLRKEGIISDEIMHKLVRELDHEELKHRSRG